MKSLCAFVLLAGIGHCVEAADPPEAAKLESIGPIAFAPKGVLLVSDPKQATIFAFETGAEEASKKAPLNVENLNTKVADMLGTKPAAINIRDLAVHPATGKAYLAVLRGTSPIILVVAGNKISEFKLDGVKFTKATLPNVHEDKEIKTRRGSRNRRMDSITDVAYTDGQVVVAGLSNEEFASKLRSIDFPFTKSNAGASVEVFHGAHGRLETNSPVRTLVPITIGDDPHLLAAYTCTPLVKFPLSDLKPGKKVKGTTIAELGNRNRPLDMVVYKKGGKEFLLIANSARKVMKASTKDVGAIKGITDRVRGTAGLKYETLDWEGVEQLAQFDDGHAAIITTSKMNDRSAARHLKTVALP